LRREYPSDVFPGVWNKLDELLRKQVLCSVEEVYYEIMAKDDDLTDWAKANRHIFILQKEVLQILKTHSNLIDVRKDKSGADPFLIAAAMIHKCSVVTEEKPSGGPDRSKIPDVLPDRVYSSIRYAASGRIKAVKSAVLHRNTGKTAV